MVDEAAEELRDYIENRIYVTNNYIYNLTISMNGEFYKQHEEMFDKLSSSFKLSFDEKNPYIKELSDSVSTTREYKNTSYGWKLVMSPYWKVEGTPNARNQSFRPVYSDEELNVSNDNNVRLLSLDTTILENYEEKFIELLKKYNPYIEMDIKNSIGCSTAMAYEWIKFGGRKVVVSFNGIGNHVPFEELICALRFIDGRDLKTNTKILPKILECYEKITNKRIYLNKAIVGKDIFNVESGIHVDGIFKNPKTYEPFDPAFVGRKRNFIIGKHSGIRSLKIKLGQLQIPIDHINLDNLLTFIREESNSKKRALLDNEIYELCMKVGGYCE
jgi:homocitrate synthase NifV